MTTEPPHDLPGEASIPDDAEDRTPWDFDEDHWDAFLPDDDQRDPLPEPGDFWIESDQRGHPESAA